MRTNLLPFLALSCALVFPGCETLTKHANLTRIATKAATAAVIKGDVQRAQRVANITGLVRAQLTGNSAVTVAELERVVRDEINWGSLDPVETALIEELIVTVRDTLIEELSRLKIEDERVLVVADVLGWIEDTARLYLAP